MAPRSQKNAEETVDSPRPSNKDPLTEPPKPTSKIIRILTVFVYVLSVSLTAILLSIYYIFLWKGEPHLGANRQVIGEWTPVPVIEDNKSSIADSSLSPRFEKFQETPYIITDLETTPTNLLATEKDEDGFIMNIEKNVSEEFRSKREMQQQLTAVEVVTVSKNSPISTTSEGSNSWLDEYDSLEELSRSSTFMRKIMENDSYQA